MNGLSAIRLQYVETLATLTCSGSGGRKAITQQAAAKNANERRKIF
jgi:hypothetical protein